MKKCITTFIIAITLINSIFGQIPNEMGLPLMHHYTYKEYEGSTQICCEVQDKRGVMYFGDNSDILEFDGKEWKHIQISNNSVVRSLAVDSSGRVYVSATNEFGFLQPDIKGELKYVSLSQKLKQTEQKVGK